MSLASVKAWATRWSAPEFKDGGEILNCEDVQPVSVDVLALLAVVEALPKCEGHGDAVPGCGAIATKVCTARLCDDCAMSGCIDLPYAAALRLVLK